MNPFDPRLLHPKYRPDIDGLRAIAVLSVVAFHVFPSVMKGGFIGVDVFFVISGFLISTIIFESLDNGTFRLSQFYARRVRRIFPALLLVLIACFALGWFILLSEEYKQLGKHIAGGAGFVSNYLLWNEAGYFDHSAETKPLLHLWSMGIEEQFYIVWPLLLSLSWGRRFNLLALASLLVLISFAFNVKGVYTEPVGTFYSSLTRAWELLSGSLLAWVVLYKKEQCQAIKRRIGHGLAIDSELSLHVLSFLGMGLLTFGFWTMDRDLSFPGEWALVPVLGSILVISAGPKALLNRTLLSNRVAVGLGLISFPLYLWHWPLLSFARILASDAPSLSIRVAIVMLAIVLSWLTYRALELPIRKSQQGGLKVAALLALMLLVGCLGFYIYAHQGLKFRDIVKNSSSLRSGEDGWAGVDLDPHCGVEDEVKSRFYVCEQDKRKPLKYALVGDSRAAALWDGLVRTSSDQGRWIFIGGNGKNGALVPVVSNNEIYKSYQRLSRVAIAALAKNKEVKDVVFVTATRSLFQLANDRDIEDLPSSHNDEAAFKGLKASISLLRDAGKKVILVVDNPTLPPPEDCLDRVTGFFWINRVLVKRNPKCELPLARHLFLSQKYRRLLEQLRAEFPGDVQIFDPTRFYCDEKAGLCGPRDRATGRFLYSYSDHISDFAAGLVGKELNHFLAGF